MSGQHRIDVSFPGEDGGPHSITIDDHTFRTIRNLVLAEQVRKVQEQARQTADAFRNFNTTFTFTIDPDHQPEWARPGRSSFFEDLFGDERPTQSPPRKPPNKTFFFDKDAYTPPAEPQPKPEPARPATPRTTYEAISVLEHYVDVDTTWVDGPQSMRTVVRKAKRITHPDTGGTAADFQLVTAAEAILRSARRI